jgi:tRNA pseudouridine32 synthase/23S rRNA pseudouridine746 synthase
MSDNLIYQDEHLLVMNKPAGLLTTPGRFEKECLWSWAKTQAPTAQVVHRLDLDTSGLVMFGCSPEAVSGLNRLFRERAIDKQYDAMSVGRMGPDRGRIVFPLGPDRLHRPKQKIDWRAGKRAETEFEVVHRAEDQLRLVLRPITGVRHQLRIHLALIGLPLLGCDLYAPRSVRRASPRLMLHARALSLPHPVTGKALTFDAGPIF